ncbi:MAG: hypothetical protein ABJ000_04825 [Saccharospirillum sp.]|uniref:hypothetical protein n=1 Tax=Saccharospirillum sp. TaxID=2033801 RepID=UPI0032982A23
MIDSGLKAIESLSQDFSYRKMFIFMWFILVVVSLLTIYESYTSHFALSKDHATAELLLKLDSAAKSENSQVKDIAKSILDKVESDLDSASTNTFRLTLESVWQALNASALILLIFLLNLRKIIKEGKLQNLGGYIFAFTCMFLPFLHVPVDTHWLIRMVLPHMLVISIFVYFIKRNRGLTGHAR